MHRKLKYKVSERKINTKRKEKYKEKAKLKEREIN